MHWVKKTASKSLGFFSFWALQITVASGVEQRSEIGFKLAVPCYFLLNSFKKKPLHQAPALATLLHKHLQETQKEKG